MNRKESFLWILVVFMVFASGNSSGNSRQLLKTIFFPEPSTAPPVEEEHGPPTFLGKVLFQDSLGNWMPRKPLAGALQPFRHGRALTVGNDTYVQDGSETSVAVNYDDENNLTGVYNPYNRLDPLNPHSNSTDGNTSWTSRSFPEGSRFITGSPFDPWANPGNSAGEFFSTLIRLAASPHQADGSRCIVSRSVDGGANFSLFYEETNPNSSFPFQDKEAVDIDRTTARGGGSGAVHDGNVYLCYDIFDLGFFTYGGTFLQAISSGGAALSEIPLEGMWPQPVAGVVDGSVYVKSGTGPLGGTMTVRFHEITNGGAGPNTLNKSLFSYTRAGYTFNNPQYRPFINGHRIDPAGYLDIDRSSGPRRGCLYYISNRNPNPGQPTQDQGDVYISASTDSAVSWSSALIPTVAGKTQYFPLLDVDEQGWLHVAYYQNDTGSINGGVLYASTANLHYTVSTDGGNSWTPPVQVNDPANALDYEDPPPIPGSNTYLIGDYQSMQAAGSGSSTKAYVLWTGYDKDRSDTLAGDAKARVYCTTVQSFPQCQNDTEAPVVTCPADMVASAGAGQCSTLVNFSATAQDNCPLGVALICDPPSGSFFPVGTDTVVCIATDLAANADTCSFAVAVSAVKGDMNASGDLTPADVVLLLNCVFLASGNCDLCFADANCSGDLSPADVVLELNAVFLAAPLPC